MSKCKNYKFAEGNIKGNLNDLGLVKKKKKQKKNRDTKGTAHKR